MGVAQERRRWTVVFDAQRKAPEYDGGAAAHFGLRDLLAIEERTVPPAQIGHDAVIAVDPEAGMTARDARVVDCQIADCRTADDRIAGRQRMATDLAITRVDESEHGTGAAGRTCASDDAYHR